MYIQQQKKLSYTSSETCWNVLNLSDLVTEVSNVVLSWTNALHLFLPGLCICLDLILILVKSVVEWCQSQNPLFDTLSSKTVQGQKMEICSKAVVVLRPNSTPYSCPFALLVLCVYER